MIFHMILCIWSNKALISFKAIMMQSVQTLFKQAKIPSKEEYK